MVGVVGLMVVRVVMVAWCVAGGLLVAAARLRWFGVGWDGVGGDKPAVMSAVEGKLSKLAKLEEEKRLWSQMMTLASGDSSKQGRMIEKIDQDVVVTLVTPTKVSSQKDQFEDQLGVLSAAKVLTDAARVHTYSRRRRAVSTGSGGVSTASRIVSSAGMIQQVNIIIASSSATKDKGKAILTESKPKQTTTKLKQRQERAGYWLPILYTFDELKELFETTMKHVSTFTSIETEDKERESELASGSSKRPRVEHDEEHDEESVKKQKLVENDAEKEELRACLDIVSRDENAMDFESLATKYPIIDWKTHILTENMMYYQIIRADESSKNYKIFSEMFDDFDRQDVVDLHRLVQERYETTSYNLTSWRLFDSSGVHVLLMDNGISIHMMIEKKYPLTREMLSKMINRRLEVDHESEMAFELLRFTRSQLKK
ncbi:hypothetical protein Tco_1417448 [Tanacetum coccineum]